MNSRFVAVMASTLFSALAGCGGSGSSAGNGADPPAASALSTVTFTMVYTDVLTPSCTICHSPGGAGYSAGALDMSTQDKAYASFQKTAAGASCKSSDLMLVVPGDAAMSLLYEKVASAHPPCGGQMPYSCTGSTCLPEAQVQEIEDWINGGAKDD